MGVKYGREYKDIHRDLVEALGAVDDMYLFFEMEETDWSALDEEEQRDCVATLADDVFYALGSDSEVEVGSALAVYDRTNHIIKLVIGEHRVHLVYLI